MSVRQWLRANNYNDVADTIDEILAEFKAAGSKERRNWADVLTGHDGKPVTIAGREFPILASAQRSRGKPVTPTAIQRNEIEEFPDVRKDRPLAQDETSDKGEAARQEDKRFQVTGTGKLAIASSLSASVSVGVPGTTPRLPFLRLVVSLRSPPTHAAYIREAFGRPRPMSLPAKIATGFGFTLLAFTRDSPDV
jgi:hypothetical protein